ncbi:hypothetical protein [Sagittula sp. S175]|uniref:hypothetical protein n=1 Tax=Sagittula sp. S175 TaxID=3415129 RepID=UPI003C7BA182
MTTSTAFQAMVLHLLQLDTDAEFMIPGGTAKSLPRYWAQNAGAGVRTFDLGGAVQADVALQVSVETDASDDATQNEAMVAALESHFRPGTRFGGVTIIEPPSPRPAILDGGVYSVPVIIRGRTVF